jgi:hypothetical protein
VSIEWLRDLAIVILGLGVTLVAIFIGIIAFMVYRKVKPVLDSAKATARRIDNVSACVEEEIAQPLARLAGIVQGMRYMSGLFSRFRRK